MKKQGGKFKEERKGYCKKDVDGFIEKSEKDKKETVLSLKEKIDDLAKENLELKKRIQAFKDKEKSVSDALLLAGQKAGEQEILLYKKLKDEETRLKNFINRWTAFINDQSSSEDVFKKRYQIEEYLKCAERELVAELNKHFTYLPPLSPQEAQFISESKRLAKIEMAKNDDPFFK